MMDYKKSMSLHRYIMYKIGGGKEGIQRKFGEKMHLDSVIKVDSAATHR